MSNTTLDPEIIEAVHAHFKAGGSSKPSAIAAAVSCSKDDVRAYVDAVIEKYPDDYEKKEPEAPKAKEAELHGPTDLGTVQTFHLLNDKGILQPLAVVSNKPGKVVLKFDEPKDVVTIMFRGVPKEVDLHQVRKTGISPLEGLSSQAVLIMGEAARAV